MLRVELSRLNQNLAKLIAVVSFSINIQLFVELRPDQKDMK